MLLELLASRVAWHTHALLVVVAAGLVEVVTSELAQADHTQHIYDHVT